MRLHSIFKGSLLRSWVKGVVQRNIIANYIGQSVGVLIPLVALPYYLSMLGSSNWGLVSLSMLLQGFMSMFGAGMSQAIVREVALRKGDTPEHRNDLAGLLIGLERLYWVIGLVCAAVLLVLSSWLAQLLIRPALPQGGALIIILAGLVFTAQFVATPYKAILYGTEQQVRSNAISLLWLLIRHASALTACYLYGSAIAYLALTAFCVTLELLSFRSSAWGLLAVNKAQISVNTETRVKGIIRLTGPLTLSVVISLLAMQIDKWAVATELSTDALGMYTIASTLGLGVLNLFIPIASAYQPSLIHRVGSNSSLRAINTKLAKLFFAYSLALIVGYLLFGSYALHRWLRNSEYVESIYSVVGILLIGSCLNAMYNVGYMNWLARGETQKILRANFASLLTVLLIVPITTHLYGMNGAAVGWLVANFICFILSLDWLKDTSTHA